MADLLNRLFLKCCKERAAATYIYTENAACIALHCYKGSHYLHPQLEHTCKLHILVQRLYLLQVLKADSTCMGGEESRRQGGELSRKDTLYGTDEIQRDATASQQVPLTFFCSLLGRPE